MGSVLQSHSRNRKMTTFTNELHFDVPMKVYREAEGEYVSALKEMEISPKHFLQKKNEAPKPPTPAQRMGTVTHSVVFEDDHSGYIVTPATFPHTKKGVTTIQPWNGRAGYCKDWKAEQEEAGKLVLTIDDVEDLRGMVVSLKNHPMANLILWGPGGRNEVCCFKKHTWTELQLKGRTDRLTTDADSKTVVVDLKTTGRGEARKSVFAREIDYWKYHMQAAFYQDLFEASFFVFVAVEKEAPYAVSTFSLDPESIQIGRDMNDKFLAKVKECRDSGIWPAYSDNLEQISLTDWAKKKAKEV